MPVSRRPIRMLAALALAAALAAAAPAGAAEPITRHLNVGASGDCPAYGDLRVCSGQVPSFDGTRIDVDLTLPKGLARSGSHPLVVMVHGGGPSDANKHEFQSLTDAGNGADRFRWNSHWFARHGFYVLTFTQRGYRTEQPLAWQPPTPSGSSASLPAGTIRLTSREVSVPDMQWLAALVADSFAVDPNRVVVTGRASGGGESWLSGLEPVWDDAHERDPDLPVLRLVASLPRVTWTDLAYAFQPNGRGGGPNGDDLYASSLAPQERPGEGVIGPAKSSFLAATYTLVANRQGILEAGTSETPGEGRVNLHAWLLRGLAGEPQSDPLSREAAFGLTRWRSPFYDPDAWRRQAEAGRPLPVFAIQGWTDDLFYAVELFRQFKFLKRLDPDWPIHGVLADVGNPRAQNPARVWRALNERAWEWLSAVLDGEPLPDAERPLASFPTECPPGDGDPEPIRAATPEGLGPGTLRVGYGGAAKLVSSANAADPSGPATDPLIASRLQPAAGAGLCIVGGAPAPGTYSRTSPPLAAARSYAGLGHVDVPYRLSGERGALHVRLWDVAPDGRALLVTRGVRTIEPAAGDARAGVARVPLFGNHWRIAAGHALRLDLSQSDAPFFRPLNLPSALAVESPALELPLVEEVEETIGAGGGDAR